MDWIRENKPLAAILGVIIVGSLALGYLLFDAWSVNAETKEGYLGLGNQVAGLKGAQLAPTEANLKAKQDSVAEYAKLVAEVKAAGVRFVHVTPPLVYSVAENPPKMKMRSWMIDTFKDDTIFDLQDIESMDGGQRCEEGGTWRICQANRSTVACPSKGQGIDEDGAGHICASKAQSYAKALLFAIQRAGR